MYLDCLYCGYDLSGTTAPCCPECGKEIGYEEKRAWERRAELLASAPNHRRKVLWALVVTVGVCVIGVVFLFPDQLGQAVEALLLCTVAVVGAWGSGYAAARCVPEHDRAVMVAIWQRRMLYLHAPWLSIPIFCGVLALGAGIWNVAFPPSGGVDGAGPGIALALLLCIVWGLGALANLVQWSSLVSLDVDRMIRRNPKRVGRLAVMVGLVVYLGAVGLGFAGGVVGSMGVLTRILHAHPFD